MSGVWLTTPAQVRSTRSFASGVAVRVGAGSPPEGLVRVLHPAGSLLGIGERREGRIHPRVVLAGAPSSAGPTE